MLQHFHFPRQSKMVFLFIFIFPKIVFDLFNFRPKGEDRTINQGWFSYSACGFFVLRFIYWSKIVNSTN